MAIVGHWDSLAEAHKLTQSMLLQGIIETVISEGALIPRLPLKQISGKDLVYNREQSWTIESGGGFFDIRELIPWTSDVKYDQITTPLKRIARQDPADNFVAATYNNVNDYKSLVLTQVTKRLTHMVEDALIYADVDYGSSKEFDGIHAIAEENTGDLDIDEEEGPLSLMNLRKLLDAAKVDVASVGRGNVIILCPREIARRLDAGYEEAGLVRSSVTHAMSQISFGRNEAGTRITFFDGVPVVKSNFLVAEEANTGVGSNKRAKNSSGTKQYSLFVIRFGQTEDGGLSLLFGGGDHDVGEIFKRTPFDKLEGYDSFGERLVSYIAPTLGAQHSLGRIYDITDAEITP